MDGSQGGHLSEGQKVRGRLNSCEKQHFLHVIVVSTASERTFPKNFYVGK